MKPLLTALLIAGLSATAKGDDLNTEYDTVFWDCMTEEMRGLPSNMTGIVMSKCFRQVGRLALVNVQGSKEITWDLEQSSRLYERKLVDLGGGLKQIANMGNLGKTVVKLSVKPMCQRKSDYVYNLPFALDTAGGVVFWGTDEYDFYLYELTTLEVRKKKKGKFAIKPCILDTTVRTWRRVYSPEVSVVDYAN